MFGWEIGDYLRYIGENGDLEGFTEGEEYEIKNLHRNGDNVPIEWKVKNDDGESYWIDANYFEVIKIKKIPVTEIDYLDCFQANFKEGV